MNTYTPHSINTLRLIHSWKPSYICDEPKKRIASFKTEDLYLSEKENKEENLILTEEEVNKLKDFNELLKDKSINHIQNPLEIDKILQDINSNTSSLLEAFPNYIRNDDYQNIVDYISNFSKIGSEEIYRVLKDNGTASGLKIIALDPFMQEKLRLQTDPAINAILQIELEAKVLEIQGDLDSKTISLTDVTNISTKIENGLDVSRRVLDILMKNQSNVNTIMGQAGLMSTVHAYRGLLSRYMKIMYEPYPSSIKINNTHEEYREFLELRQHTVRKFNRFAIPVLAVYFIYLESLHQVISKKLENYLVSRATGSIFLSNKIPNYWTLLLVPILSLTSVWTIPPIILYCSPSLYNYLDNIEIGPQWFTYPVLFWMIAWVLYYILELYIYVMFIIDRDRIIIPKHLPRLVLKWIHGIDEQSKLLSKGWILHMSLKIILFHSVLTLLFIYFWIL